MNRIFLIALLLFPFLGSAQFSNDAPWMQNSSTNQRVSELTLAEISNRANSFFEQIDIDKKGSGYKPFKRSEYHWSFYLNEDGTIAKPEKLWEAWRQKKLMEQGATSRSVQVVSDWQPRGPYSFIDSGSWSSGQGRVNVLVVDPVDANTYYLGAPAGGLWKSVDAGASWTPLTDNLPQIGVSGIAIDPNNPDIIYITTGDDDAGDSYFVGVMKSTDGGLTWNSTGTISGNSANEIYIDPSNSSIVWVATDSGLYKSTNSGDSWVNKKSGNIKDFKLKIGDSSTIYAVTNSQFFKSTDGGASFVTITDGFPTSSSRLTIDVTPANTNCVYVLSASSGNFQGVYKSTDSGATFSRTAETNDIFDGSSQSWYDMALGVSDVDENTLFVGVLNVWKSTDGGDSFTRINEWNNDSGATYTHADIHFLRYYNGNLFAGTDGGIFRSTDNGGNFTNLTAGVAISQFYKISVSKQSSANMAGGLQDNGGFAYNNGQWYNYYGADGMDAAVDPLNQNIYYGFIQNGGGLYKTTQGGPGGQYVAGTPQSESGAWVTPLVMSSDGVLHAGYNKLYKLVNNNWIRVSSSFEDFGGKLKNIEIDPSNTQNVYLSRGSTLFLSEDGGVNYTDYGFSNTVTSIEVHNTDSNVLWVTTLSGVYKSTDKGVNWTNITANLPSESKNVIRHQNYHPDNPIYVGTNLGVYYRDDTMSNWEVFSTNLPNVSITDLEINVNDEIITASTYGRGVWQSAIPVVLVNDDVRLVSIDNPGQGVSCGAIDPIIKVKNNGLNTINSIDIDYTIDGTPYNQTWNGTLTSEEEVPVTLQTINLDLGNHSMEVTITIPNDTYSENNTLSTSFSTNAADDTPTIVNTFEENTDAWLIDSETNLWKMSAPETTQLNTVASGTKAYITNPAGNYPDNNISNLVSPCYDLTTITNPVISFKMAFDIEVDWDVLYMQYSTDNGNTWDVLGTANDPNWYNNTYTDHDLTIGGQWSGVATTLTEYTYDLAALTDESNIMFRFHFASDQNTTGEGALIDDFVILGETVGVDDYLEQQVKLFPNPTAGQFTIDWANDTQAKVRIYDITGKQLLGFTLNSNSQKTIDLNHYAKGVYLVNFQTDTNLFTKKLMVE